jgi:hypothetical protein
MNAKSVTILKGIDPVEVVENPSAETYEYLSMILKDERFSSMIYFNRKAFGVPEDGEAIRKIVGRKLSDILDPKNNLVSALYASVYGMLVNLNLPKEMIDQVFLLVYCNAFIDLKHFEGLTSQPIQFIAGKRNIASKMFDYPYQVGAIILPVYVSQNRLVKYIKDHWAEISKEMDNNLSDDPYINRMHKNTLIADEIMELVKNGKTYPQVADYLNEEFKLEGEETLTEEKVKQYHRRYKDLIDKYKKALSSAKSQ